MEHLSRQMQFDSQIADVASRAKSDGAITAAAAMIQRGLYPPEDPEE